MKPIPGMPIESQPIPVVFEMGLCGEARGEGIDGMRAVAQCIVNRRAHPNRYGEDDRAIWLKPWQFSCFNANDPNRAKMLDFWTSEPMAWQMACDVYRELDGGTMNNLVGGSTHYCTSSLWGQDQAERIAAGKAFQWFSKQALDAGITIEIARVGHQVFGTTA